MQESAMIPLDELKVALRAPSDTVQDDYITALEVAAVAYVERATGNVYGEGVDTVVHVIGLGTAHLWLSTPFATPTVLERAYPGATETTAITDFSVRDGYLLRSGGAVWISGYEYEVTGDSGYAEGSEPAIARQAVMQTVTHWFENRMPVVVGMPVADVPLSVKELLVILTHFPVAL